MSEETKQYETPGNHCGSGSELSDLLSSGGLMDKEEIAKMADGCIQTALTTGYHPYTVLNALIRLSGMGHEQKEVTRNQCAEYMMAKQQELPWKM